MPEDYTYLWPGLESPDMVQEAQDVSLGLNADDAATGASTEPATQDDDQAGRGIVRRRVTLPDDADGRQALHDSAVADIGTYSSAAYDAVNDYANSGRLDELRRVRKGAWNPFKWLSTGSDYRNAPYTDRNGNYVYDPSGAFADTYGNRYISNGQFQEIVGREWRNIRQTANNDPWVLARRYLYSEDADRAIKSIDDASKTMLRFTSQIGSVSAGGSRLYASWADGANHVGWSEDAEDANRNMEAAAALLAGARNTVESGPGIFMGMRQAVLDPDTYFLGIGGATEVRPALKSLNRHIEGLGDGSRTDALTFDETMLLQSLALSSEMNSFMQPLVTGTGVKGGRGIVDFIISSLELWAAFEAGNAIATPLIESGLAKVFWRFATLDTERFEAGMRIYLERPDVFERLSPMQKEAVRRGGAEFLEEFGNEDMLKQICSYTGKSYKEVAEDIWEHSYGAGFNPAEFEFERGDGRYRATRAADTEHTVVRGETTAGEYTIREVPEDQGLRMPESESAPLLTEEQLDKVVANKEYMQNVEEAVRPKTEIGESGVEFVPEAERDAASAPKGGESSGAGARPDGAATVERPARDGTKPGEIVNRMSRTPRADYFGENTLNFLIDNVDSDSNGLAAELIFSDASGLETDLVETFDTAGHAVAYGRTSQAANQRERKFGHKRAEYMDRALENAAKNGRIPKMNEKEKNEFFIWLAEQNTGKFNSHIKVSEMWNETDFPAVPDDSKIQKIIFKWYTDGAVAPGMNEQAIYEAIATAEKLHLDAMHFPSPESLLNSEEVASRIGVKPDGMPGLTLFRDIGEGVKVYTIEDTEEARESMRKIIDTHYGKKAQPWCILQSNGEGKLIDYSKTHWDDYPYGRMAAFKDGKLVAFNASSKPEKRLGTNWRDMTNKFFDGIPYNEKTPDGFTKRTKMDIDGKIMTQYLEKGDRKKWNYIKKDPEGNVLEYDIMQKGSEFGGNTYRSEIEYVDGVKETTIIKTNSSDKKVTEETFRSYNGTGKTETIFHEFNSSGSLIRKTSTTYVSPREKTVVKTNYDGLYNVTGKTTEIYKNGKLSSYIIEEPIQDEFGTITSSYNGSGRLLSVDVKTHDGLTRTYDSRQQDKAAIIRAISMLAPVATLPGFLSPQMRDKRRASRHYAERHLNRLSKRTDVTAP